jgi:hypothetical protein
MNYKDGRTIKKHFCIDCGKKVWYQSIRCKSCASKGRKNSNYKGGKPHCVDCNKEIWWGRKRCIECWCKYLKQKPPFKGKHLTEEAKEKIRKKAIGRIGKKSSGWKGGITSLWQLIRENSLSKEWRNKVFKRDNYQCQNCGDNKGNNLNAHHKKEFNLILQDFLQEYNQFSPYEDKETLVRLATKWKPFWDVNNGITYCKKCHKEVHNGKFTSYSK